MTHDRFGNVRESEKDGSGLVNSSSATGVDGPRIRLRIRIVRETRGREVSCLVMRLRRCVAIEEIDDGVDAEGKLPEDACSVASSSERSTSFPSSIASMLFSQDERSLLQHFAKLALVKKSDVRATSEPMLLSGRSAVGQSISARGKTGHPLPMYFSGRGFELISRFRQRQRHDGRTMDLKACGDISRRP